MNKIDIVKRAIEFKYPPYMPFELWDVPYIYNAYGTKNPKDVKLIEGTEDFDSLIVSYNWTLDEIGINDDGEKLKRDEWGISYRIPNDTNTNYIIMSHPLRGKNDIVEYKFPNPKVTEKYFEKISMVINERYQGRFISAYIDPGAFIIAAFLFGYDELFINLIEKTSLIRDLMIKIFEYHRTIVWYFKQIGAHMITYIDEVAGTKGMMISPKIFRNVLSPLYKNFFEYIHSLNLYTCCLFDGNISEIVPDILLMDTDCVQFMAPNDTGIENIEKYFKGKRCIKASVDMRNTLATGDENQVIEEAHKLVHSFNSYKGGFIPIILRWFRPEYPEKNVLASVKTFRNLR